VPSISADSVLRVLLSHGLRPWRVKAWLSPRVPRDAAFAATVKALCELYTRPLAAAEVVLCLDEKTSIQPRKRTAATLPAAPGQPLRVEHEYVRGGALHLFAAFDTRTGKVTAVTATGKSAIDFIRLLEELDRTVPAEKSLVHLVLDNLSVHKSKAVAAWLETHPRFVLHFPPVHCSWLNQVEQWFSILQRKALKAPNFADKEKLAEHLHRFIAHWNRFAHPFKWSTKSIAKVMARCAADDALSVAA
jgi:transposase